MFLRSCGLVEVAHIASFDSFANPTAGILVDRGDGHWELDPGPEGARVAVAKSAKL